MKKVAVITLKDSPNYGGILQAYALQKAIENLTEDGTNSECVLINYMNDDFRHKFTFFGKPKGMTSVYWIFKKVQYPIMRVMMKRMMPFYRHMRVTKKFIHLEQLSELNKEFDLFITGSDQVWACDLNYHDPSYFLSFVDDKHKKVSYAASFGRTVDMLKPDECAFIAPQLRRFDAIGVREDSGVDVVKMLINRDDAVSVLDPTLLLDKNDWEKVASHEHKGTGNKYILCYLMQGRQNDKEALKLAKTMSKKTGMPIVKICRGLTSLLWGETLYIPTVEEWLGLFMDAEYVITNSFHGMAFSANFQKNFTVFIEGNPKTGRNSRIYDRCRDFGLLDRIKVVGETEEINTSEIDYVKISKNIETGQRKSVEFLRKVLIDD